MAKSAHADVLDAMGAYIAANADLMIACSSQPTTYAEATTTYALADTAVTSDSFAQAADGTGRKCVTDAIAGVTVDASGTFAHVAFVDTAATGKLLYVTTGTSQVLTAGNTVDFPSFAICKVAQPS